MVGVCYYIYLNPAAAGSLPTLITHTEQTSAGKSGRCYIGKLAPEEKDYLKDKAACYIIFMSV